MLRRQPIIHVMELARKPFGEKLRFIATAAMMGWALYLVGLWSRSSMDIPSHGLVLPLPAQILGGLGLCFCTAFLIPITLLLTTSWATARKLPRFGQIALALASLASLILCTLWAPGPLVLWPSEFFGDAALQTVAQVIHQYFPVHVIPAPPGNVGDASAAMLLWPIHEYFARYCLAVLFWSAALFAIRKIAKKIQLPAAFGA